jgi:CTP-dependent riboflavin kinase
MPIAHEKVSKYAQNRCIWNNEGSAIISGDSTGNINLYGLSEKYRKMENSKYEDLQRYLKQKPE